MPLTLPSCPISVPDLLTWSHPSSPSSQPCSAQTGIPLPVSGPNTSSYSGTTDTPAIGRTTVCMRIRVPLQLLGMPSESPSCRQLSGQAGANGACEGRTVIPVNQEGPGGALWQKTHFIHAQPANLKRSWVRQIPFSSDCIKLKRGWHPLETVFQVKPGEKEDPRRHSHNDVSYFITRRPTPRQPHRQGADLPSLRGKPPRDAESFPPADEGGVSLPEVRMHRRPQVPIQSNRRRSQALALCCPTTLAIGLMGPPK